MIIGKLVVEMYEQNVQRLEAAVLECEKEATRTREDLDKAEKQLPVIKMKSGKLIIDF